MNVVVLKGMTEGRSIFLFFFFFDTSDGTCSDKSGLSDYPRTYQALIIHYSIYVSTLFRYLTSLG